MTHRSVGVAAVLLGACASLGLPGQLTTTARDQAIQQASFDHKCPAAQVSVLRHSQDSKSLELSVCGTARRYQAVGGAWLEAAGDASQSMPVGEER